MKKILVLVLCLVLAFCFVGCKKGGKSSDDGAGSVSTNTVSDSQSTVTGKPVISAQDVTGAVGETVTVVYSASANNNIAAADFEIDFDTSVLEYVGFKQVKMFENGFVTGNLTDSKVVKVAYVTLAPANDGGELFSVQFKIKKDCKKGTKLGIKYTECCDLEHNRFELDCKTATVFSK